MNIVKKNDRVIEVRMKYQEGFKQRVLLVSDIHLDSIFCNRKLFKKHLDEAKELNAPVIIVGDLLDAMQGKGDKRSQLSDLSIQFKKDDYYTEIADYAIEFLKDNKILLISEGNHESSIRKHLNFDLLKYITKGLNCQMGLYSGFVIFRFEHESGGHVKTKILRYSHAMGGFGSVSKGINGVSKVAQYIPDADILIGGHNHEVWYAENIQERINRSGDLYLRRQVFLNLPTYKEEYLKGKDYHTESNRPPKPIGGWWLEFIYRNGTIEIEVIRAV